MLWENPQGVDNLCMFSEITIINNHNGSATVPLLSIMADGGHREDAAIVILLRQRRVRNSCRAHEVPRRGGRRCRLWQSPSGLDLEAINLGFLASAHYLFPLSIALLAVAPAPFQRSYPSPHQFMGDHCDETHRRKHGSIGGISKRITSPAYSPGTIGPS
jgi:hypothetical protein